MLKRGKQTIKNYMTLEYEFTGIRLQEGHLTPVDWDLSIDIIVNKKKGKARDDVEIKATVAFQRLYFWLDANLPEILTVDVTNEDDLYIANLSSNIMMYCPGNPGDDMLIRLIHSKLTVLGQEDITVGEVRLKSSDTSLQYTFDSVDGEYELPASTEEYYTEGTVRDKEPWWDRYDGFCFEFVRPSDAKEEITDEELFKDIVDPLDEFEKMVELSEASINVVREPAKIIQVEKWKPKKVE